ncbi:MAG: Zn-ribbon domain-containing OB-fold protein [Actinomycetota bacterium]|nr:Zn-ribbon domain-containing OB-fold protein [Actinomycetota bacterium]
MAHDRELPTVEDETRPYWKAAADGTLLIKKCNACGEVHHYPRPFCPSCWSDDVAWQEASGRGTVYTYSTIFRNDLPPFDAWGAYIAAVVELEEGPRLMTNIVDCPPEECSVGMPVVVDFRPLTDDIGAPIFRRA